MSELEQMLEDSAIRLFSNEVTLAQIEAMEQGQWPSALWQAIEDSGLARVLVDEANGGAELGWSEGLPVLLAAARALAPVPFTDTALCGWLLARLGLPVPPGPIGLAALEAELQAVETAQGWILSGQAEVPWGRHAGHVLARARTPAADIVWLLLPTQGCAVAAGENIAGEPRDRLSFDAARALAAAAGDPLPSAHGLRPLGALMRAIDMAGVLERVLDQTVRYAGERVQFGRPIGKFQAIQQQLAVLANEVVAARMAVSSACAALPGEQWAFQAMVAKVVCGQAAGRVASIAHQVHGAIGFTREHSLHFATRRLWSWRAEYGSEAFWAARIGEQAIRAGGAALWPALTQSA